MLWNVLIVKLEKLYTVNLYVFLSALYTLQYVPIVIISVIVYLFKKKKKKKKKKEKNDPYFGMGKNTKVMPQYHAIYLFSWEREGILMSQNLTKYKCAFCPTLSMRRFRFRQNVDNARQNCPKYVHFAHEFCTFPVTEGNEI